MFLLRLDPEGQPELQERLGQVEPAGMAVTAVAQVSALLLLMAAAAARAVLLLTGVHTEVREI